MFENWFSPSKALEGKDFGKFNPTSFGNSLKNHKEFSPGPDYKNHLAFIGLDHGLSDLVRSYLTQLACPWAELPLIDLGNIRRQEPNFAIQAIKAAVASDLMPIVIGGDNSTTRVINEAFQEYSKKLNLAYLGDKFDLIREDPTYWLDVLEGKVGHLHQFSVLSHQLHFLNSAEIEFLNNWALDELRLGDLRANLAFAEPVVRNAEFISIKLNALRFSDAPGQTDSSPNGLFGEELCQIARYAGMSEKSRALGLHGYDINTDKEDTTAKLIAQTIWYFVDGVINRKVDYPMSNRHLTEYIIDSKNLGDELTFWKSSLTGRWWVQVNVSRSEDETQEMDMIPCTYEDYQMASKDELSGRLLRALRRYA